MAGKTGTVRRQKGEEKRDDEKAGGEESAERQPRTTHTGAAQSLHGAREKKNRRKTENKIDWRGKKRPARSRKAMRGENERKKLGPHYVKREKEAVREEHVRWEDTRETDRGPDTELPVGCSLHSLSARTGRYVSVLSF